MAQTGDLISQTEDLGVTTAADFFTTVFERATEVIGDPDQALRWLGTPVRALQFATPISLLNSQQGQLSVLAILGRLEHGLI